MATIEVTLHSAPSTPLNLAFGRYYAPRVPTPPFSGFVAREISPDVFEISGIDALGAEQVVLHSNSLTETYTRLALHLRMDVPEGGL